MSSKNPIRTLSPEVARKIAAGEVIDRPCAIIRELLDNAIDSGATNITVEITQGGIEKIRIVDNGSGMTKDDLINCARPHATSKIATEVDLLNLSTLGFRGEALASIAAVCRLSIISGGYKMRASITEDHLIENSTPLEGTIVQAEGLFENFPARRVFLKRPASEGLLCKNIFVEKSLAYPQIAFRFISEGQIKLDLPKNQTLKERFISALELNQNIKLFSEISGEQETSPKDWSFKIIIGDPGIYRPNKKDIHIFVNGRKINEFSLQQAVEYGCQGYFPNGTFPIAAVFITMNPSQVDFNIHPAKKEVRFKDISSLHHGISSSVKKHFLEYTNKTIKAPVYSTPDIFSTENNAQRALDSISNFSSKDFSLNKNSTFAKTPVFSSSSVSQYKNTSLSNFGKSTHSAIYSEESLKVADSKPEKNPNTEIINAFMDKAISAYNNSKPEQIKTDSADNIEINPTFKYIGCCLGTFILAEQNDTLFLIDQHAAHERMLFDSILENQSKSQSLLIPYVIQTKDSSEDEYLETIKEPLKQIGFTCSNLGDGKWEFSTIQERWNGTEIDLEHALLDKKVSPKDIIYSIAAMTACKAAVKDGYKLDDKAAEDIAKGALSLKDPHCPHGRPVYTTITRETLFSLVRRTR